MQQQQQQREFEEQQRQQQERERLAQEELNRQQAMQFGQQNQGRIAELEREILGMRGQWERDQMMLERYDGVSVLAFVVGKGGGADGVLWIRSASKLSKASSSTSAATSRRSSTRRSR